MTTVSDGPERYIRFGEFAFDTDSDELYRGDRRVMIRPQPAKLLHLFLTRAGQLLRQEEITNHIWPETVVDYEQRIRAAVGEVRTALGDDHEHPQFIETVSRRGYRFIFPLEQGTVRRGFQNRWRWAAAAAIALIVLFAFDRDLSDTDGAIGAREVEPAILVILPVADISVGGASGFPVDGLTHELIAETAKLAPGALAVIGRTSAMKYKGTTLPTAEIASQLGADYLLETTIGEFDTGLRATSTLVEAASGQVIWSTGLDGSYKDLQAFERQIAHGVGRALGIAFTTGEFTSAAPLAANNEAYEAYLNGLYLLVQGAGEQRARSYDYFREAAALDPNFAPAFVGIARSARIAGRPDEEFWSAIETALELDDRLAEAYFQRAARLFFDQWDWAAAERDFRAALRLDQGQTKYHLFFAVYLRAAGDYEGALIEAELSLKIDPMAELVYRDLSWLYIAMENFERALVLCQRGLDIGLANPEADHNCLMLTYREMGDLENAAKHALEIMKLEGVEDREIANIAGRGPESQMAAFWQWNLARSLARPEDDRRYFELATILSALGRHDEALDALESALKAHEPPMVFIGGDPLLAPLREDPKFQRIGREVGIPAFVDR